jgi:hypothetical protein
VLGFAIGCLLTTVVAVALLAPAPAPSAPAQTNGATLNITLTDALLTQSLSSNLGAGLGAGGVALTQPQVHIQANGEMVVSGTLQGSIAAGSDATVVVQPYVSQNTLALRTLRASIAGISLPTTVVAALLDQVNQQLRQSSRISYGVGQALVVTGVSFADGAMTLSYAPGGA